MRAQILLIIFLSLACVTLQSTQAHEKNEINDFNVVLQKIESLKRSGNPTPLLVIDIDNTLLANKTALGSDQWFEWQASLLANRSGRSPHATSRDISSLIALYSKLQGFVDVRLTQPDLPEILNKINKYKVPILFLTSRAHPTRSITESSLIKLNLMPTKQLFSTSVFNNIIIPNSPVPASYQNGVFLTAGAHKGLALNLILAKVKKKFKHIIFVDDHQKHTDRVYETFSDNQFPEIITYRYGKEDENVSNFKKSKKDKIHAQFTKLKATINDVFDYSL